MIPTFRRHILRRAIDRPKCVSGISSKHVLMKKRQWLERRSLYLTPAPGQPIRLADIYIYIYIYTYILACPSGIVGLRRGDGEELIAKRKTSFEKTRRRWTSCAPRNWRCRGRWATKKQQRRRRLYLFP